MQVMESGTRSWEVAPSEDHAAFKCRTCGQWAHNGSRLLDGCPLGCDGNVWDNNDEFPFIIGVLRQTTQFFDITQTRNTLWYHATEVSNWHQKVSESKNPFVHLGTQTAAMDRIADLQEWNMQQNLAYLHEITLDPNALIADLVFADNDVDAMSAQDFKRKGWDGVRYVNEWESVGSISLIMDSRKFLSVKTTQILL